MFDVSLLQIEQWVADFLWPLFRVASFFMAIPMIGSNLVPGRIRLGLALLVTMLLVPVLPPMPAFDGFSLQSYLIIAQQILIGAAMGFMVQMLLQVFVIGGQLISTQMGLGFASVSDPVNGVAVVVLTQFYLQLTMLLFLAMNGHLVMIDALAQSFERMPVGLAGIDRSIFIEVVRSGGWMFASALLMSLPAITALLVINFAFGIITKAAPQLNIFAIGFPFTMLMGLLIAWVSLGGFLGQYLRIATEALERVGQLFAGG
ncbi:flagellar biosynthetic protein FliR [Marinobacterium nitratireducens]|uniref:Flagellar biosynthetic protein FliR n=1 Tax=Marinobacterium nitratireducens TaxID=518897 RepID=A0A917ZLX1_9GAMM|nr:flagellar biosynthetic protein FliR [Marinobacterium nitratireducens]GGO85013.1 flagellar biosynthetic protein FliR [Marinobacterium nitratireducens]